MKNQKEDMRVSKFLAHQGVCSRREAEQMIENGWVLLDGEVITEQGVKVLVGQAVTLNAKAEMWLGGKKTILINKPPGYVSHLPEDGQTPAVRLVTRNNFYGDQRPSKVPTQGLAPAGRLDIDSTGLLILTQDGQLAKKVIGENSPVEKEYIVKVDGEVTPQKIDRLCYGLTLDGSPLKRAKVSRINETQLRFVLIEGKKRQIRRMCELVDLNVATLKRIRIGKIHLAQLPRGQWRFLDASESVD